MARFGVLGGVSGASWLVASRLILAHWCASNGASDFNRPLYQTAHYGGY